MFKLVRSSETIDRQPEPGRLIKNYLTKEFSESFSIAVGELDDSVHSVPNTEPYDRVYYCFHGQAIFQIDDEILNVSEGDAIFLSKNTAYTYTASGKFKAVIINLPAFGSDPKK
ncbi:MAG: AraC family ligand binding domain-containing protein [Firmicutes bacterium]|nr:AraC family ligand binding domain-containing protein [Bacillota bacterium]